MDTLDTLVGKKLLGFFRVHKKIGAGAFASVYVAAQEGTERLAVVKVAHPHLASDATNQELVSSRFAAEFKASTRIHHPNIATVFAAGRTDEGLPAIAMEYVPGLPLSVLLPRHAPVLLEATLPFLEQIGSALLALHRASIIHRDITPNNIVVYHDPYTQQPVYKLLDFGIAKIDDANGQTNGPIGTPRYMAPEQAEGQVHPKTDIYGLGALLWWFVTGQEYLGHIKKVSELFLHHLKKSPVPDPGQLRPGLPLGLAPLLRSMLNPYPEERPDLESLLQRWINCVGKRPTPATSWPWGQSQKELLSAAAVAPITLPGASRQTPIPQKKIRACFLTWHVNPVSTAVVSGGIRALGIEASVFSEPEQLAEKLSQGEWDVLLASGDLIHDTILLSRLKARLQGTKRLYLLCESPQEVKPKLSGLSNVEVVPPIKLPHLCDMIAESQGIDSGLRRAVSKSDGSFVDTNSRMRFDSQIEIIERFIGAMPDWLAELSEALEVSPALAIPVCRQVLMAASSVGAEHLARLASLLEEMIKAEMPEDAQGVFEEMSNEYSELFRKLLMIRSSCEHRLSQGEQVS